MAKIAFTGSDASGQKIYEAAARTIKHVTLELGGKSPNIVFDDADLEQAVFGAISGIFAATGQTCIAGSRLLLQRSIHDQFVEKLVAVAWQGWAIRWTADPRRPGRHPPQYEKILDYIDIAKAEGATLRARRRPMPGRARAATSSSSRPSSPASTTRCASRRKRCSARCWR